MKSYQELLDMKASSKCRYKRADKAVKEAVKCLIDNGFTGIDIATFMTADEVDVCTKIDEEYEKFSSPKGSGKCRKLMPIQEREKDEELSRDKILVRKDGYVRTKRTTEIKNSEQYMAIQYLEDGLSYLNYARLGSHRGMCDPEADHRTGISFVMDALCTLIDEKNIGKIDHV